MLGRQDLQNRRQQEQIQAGQEVQNGMAEQNLNHVIQAQPANQNANHQNNAVEQQREFLDLTRDKIGELMPEEINMRYTIDRALTKELLDSSKFLGDSKLMGKVKDAVRNAEAALKSDGRVLSDFDVLNTLNYYNDAIAVCKKYLADKKKNARWYMVNNNLNRLIDEAEQLTVAYRMLHSGAITEQITSAEKLLYLVRLHSLTNFETEGVAESKVDKREKPADETIKKLGFETGIIYRAISGQEQPSDIVERLSKSKNKKEKEFAKELPLLISNISTFLDDFSEGKASAKMLFIGDSTVMFSQNALGQLTFTVDGVQIPVERNTGVLVNAFENDIIKNADIYGAVRGQTIIRNIILSVGALSEEKSEDRQLLLSFLMSRTAYKSNDFSNFTSRQLRDMCSYVMNSKTVRIIKAEDADNYQASPGEEIFLDNGMYFINLSESKEILENAQKEDNREAVKANVTMPQKQQEERREGEWSEQDEKIKNMMADFVFSYDSWAADETVGKPGERMKQVLLKHRDVIAMLITDLYKDGADKRKIINSFVERLPLFMLENKDQADNNDQANENAQEENMDAAKLKDGIAKALDEVVTQINDKIKEQTHIDYAALHAEKPAFEAQKREKDKRREEEAKKRKKDEEEGDGEGFIAMGLRLAGEKAEDLAFAARELAIKPSDIIHDYLTSQNKLLNGEEVEVTGGIRLHIPSLKEIIEEKLDTASLAEADDKINEAVIASTDAISKTIKKYSDDLFQPVEEGEQEEVLDDPNERGISAEEVKKRKKRILEAGNKKLAKMAKDAALSGESGQGLFTKLVFENYFSSVSALDKRSMIGAMIRNSKPVVRLDENDPAIEDAFMLSPQERERRSDERKRRHEHNEKLVTNAKANYIGGMLKGAGPLFQKMMQGLPMEGLPEELCGAIADMKSKLAPIPDEIVEAQLNDIVTRSHNEIKNITVVRSLGAASVGQTFLCKITRQDGTVEEAAIKLLKPDARNRMMREKKIMLNLAHMTDVEGRMNENLKRQQQGLERLPEIQEGDKGGMELTYEGQLERIEEELDLTIEARNVELGKIYNKEEEYGDDKVKAMKLSNLASPTTNSMVLEKAQGETLDSLLGRIKTETEQIKNLYKRGDEFLEDGLENFEGEEREELRRQRILIRSQKPYYSLRELAELKGYEEGSKEYNEIRPDVLEEKLLKSLAELKKKKEYLCTYAKKWVTEGVFGEGFYHGDPHDGNIMIGEDGLTVIDFGNCTKLSDYQQQLVTRMLTAAAVGDMKTFRHGFHKLLKPEFETLYQEKRQVLGEKFSEIFKLGGSAATGVRIAVALLEAQKMGLEIPSAVYNFSQGQMRIQNAIDNMNRQIKECTDLALVLNKMPRKNGTAEFDFTDYEINQKVANPNGTNTLTNSAIVYQNVFYETAESAEDIASLTELDLGYMDRTYIAPLKSQIKAPMDKAIREMEELIEYCKDHTHQEQSAKATSYWNENRTVIKTFMDEEFDDEITDVFMRYPQFSQDHAEKMLQRMRKAQEDAKSAVKAFDETKKLDAKIRSAHSGKWNPTPNERKDFDEKKLQFAQLYRPFHIIKGERSNTNRLGSCIEIILSGEDAHLDRTRDNMTEFFKRHPEREREFSEAYSEFLEVKTVEKFSEDELSLELREQLREKKRKVRAIYHSIMAEQLKRKYELFRDGRPESDYGFLQIMSEVLRDKWKTTVNRMGTIKSYTTGKKFKAQKKEEDALKDVTT